MVDITARKQAETDLENALSEKEFLMKELNHRIKNNLTMITSLLSLKELETEDDLTDIKHQIDAIRLVHKKLQTADGVALIKVRDYVQELLQTIFSTFSPREVTVINRVADVSINTKTAIPLGLLINETATNAIKHGFVPGEEPVFSIGMENPGEGKKYTLTLSNTGNAFPEEVDIEEPATLGLQLVTSLFKQLNGTIRLEKKPHPVFTIRFTGVE